MPKRHFALRTMFRLLYPILLSCCPPIAYQMFTKTSGGPLLAQTLVTNCTSGIC
jgi:hypothetical protein